MVRICGSGRIGARLGPLRDHVVCDIPHYATNFLVSSYCSSSGWSWDSFRGMLPKAICQKIPGIRPPSQGCYDFPIWGFSSDGFFTIKSVYVFLYEQKEREEANFPFNLIWKWQGPHRIRSLLWKVAHGRLLTNEERMRRNMARENLCRKCNDYPETVMHTLRDCEVVSAVWGNLISEEHWSSFFSTGLLK